MIDYQTMNLLVNYISVILFVSNIINSIFIVVNKLSKIIQTQSKIFKKFRL